MFVFLGASSLSQTPQPSPAVPPRLDITGKLRSVEVEPCSPASPSSSSAPLSSSTSASPSPPPPSALSSASPSTAGPDSQFAGIGLLSAVRRGPREVKIMTPVRILNPKELTMKNPMLIQRDVAQ
ncbi:hypothetical protein Taro_027300 [Colocasia esculenta]|uniref:Uncharacterized protein n=1 Tax=Colocasia esculenta TaxID=4460 RepID=A0A843VNB2_COLES|nr:hypothetical protein [Colocasia esculenta]